MELIEDTSALDRTIQSWDYATVQHFAHEQAKNILQQKIAYYKSKTDFFGQKSEQKIRLEFFAQSILEYTK